jgi:hypothetical protein
VRLRKHEVAAADAGGDGLRERRRVRHEVAALELEQAGFRVALEADEPVRVVLEDGKLVLPHDLDEPRAPLRRERPSARVLERGNGVEERRLLAAALELGVERVGIEPLVVHLQRNDLDPLASEDLERTVVARRLDEHATGNTCELLGRVEDEAL